MKNSILALSFISSKKFYTPLSIFPGIFTISLLVCSILLPVNAQNQPPIVTEVRFIQREDPTLKVDVYYDVNDPDGNAMTVTMKASSDNGATWNYSCNNITGDVGAGITTATNKHIVWDFAAEHPQTFGDQFRIKIIADDNWNGGGTPCQGIPTVSYAGKIYNTVQIGTQCWLKENLDVGTRINGNLNQSSNGGSNFIEKYCYNDSTINCEKYGGLYQWNEAMQYSVTNNQGICPSGWHIPTYTDFQTLRTNVGNSGFSLLEVGQGGGTNIYGFSALLGGYRVYTNGFDKRYLSAYFWSSTQSDASKARNMDLHWFTPTIEFGPHDKKYGFSIRCVKD